MCLVEIDYILENLDEWIQPQKARVSFFITFL